MEYFPALSVLFLSVYLHTAAGQEAGEALKCYQCSHSTLETDNVVVSAIFGVLNRINNEHCLFRKPDQDYTEVDIRNCGATPAGKVNLCTVVNGTVTTTYQSLAGAELRIHTLTRDCVTVDEGSAEARGGCFDETADDSPAVRVLTSTFNTLNVGQVHFKGKACFYHDLTSSAATLTPARAFSVLLVVFGGVIPLLMRH